jgi:hypothetical protein
MSIGAVLPVIEENVIPEGECPGVQRLAQSNRFIAGMHPYASKIMAEPCSEITSGGGRKRLTAAYACMMLNVGCNGLFHIPSTRWFCPNDFLPFPFLNRFRHPHYPFGDTVCFLLVSISGYTDDRFWLNPAGHRRFGEL